MFDRPQFVASRRAVMSAGAALALGAAARPPQGKQFRFAVQLYPLQARFAADMPRLFADLARHGFRRVEFAGFGPHSAADIRRALGTAGIEAFGAHCLPLGRPDTELERQMEFCAEAGIPRVTTALPGVRPTDARPRPPLSAVFGGMSADDLRWSAARMNSLGEKARSRGLGYSYHTHNLDFAMVERRTVIDWLMALTSPRAVKLQLDIGNAAGGGADPLQAIEVFGPRIDSVHAKDWQPGFTPSVELKFPDVAAFGSGVIDWNAVLRALARHRVADVIVEQETKAGADALAAQIQARNYLAARRLR